MEAMVATDGRNGWSQRMVATDGRNGWSQRGDPLNLLIAMSGVGRPAAIGQYGASDASEEGAPAPHFGAGRTRP
jgi:hypothetical protein